MRTHTLILLSILTLALSGALSSVLFAAESLSVDRSLNMSPETINLMAALLKEGSSQDKTRAAMALASARVKSPKTRKLLEACLREESRELRAAAVHALTRSKTKRGLTAALKACSDQEWQVRMYALLGLKEYPPSTASTAAALKACNDKDSTVRLAALQALETLAIPSPDTKKKLLYFFKKEKNLRLKAGALEVLATRFKNVQVIDLKDAIKEPDVQIRGALLRVIANAQIEALLLEVKNNLSHTHPVVRREAITTTGVLLKNQTFAAIKTLETDSDVTVRQRFAKALGATLSLEGKEALLRLQQDPYPAVRRSASMALAMFTGTGQDMKQEILTEATTRAANGKPKVRIENLYLLGRIGDAAPLETVIPALTSALTDKVLHRMVVWTIGQCKAKSHENLVTEAVSSKDPFLRLHGAAGVGHLNLVTFLPQAGVILRKKKMMEGMPMYVYGGPERSELVRSLGLIGTPEAVTLVAERIAVSKLLEEEDTFEAAIRILEQHRATQAVDTLRSHYRYEETSDLRRARIVKALRIIQGRKDVGLDEPAIAPPYDQFFLNARR